MLSGNPRWNEWDSMGLAPALYHRLPPDLTPGGLPDRPACWRITKAMSPRGFVCTRPVDHTARHAAGDGQRIRAVWW